MQCRLSWWRWEELNLRHGAYETPALPLSYTAGSACPETYRMDFTSGRACPSDSVLTPGMFVIIPAEQTTRRSLHMQFRTHPWRGELRRPTDDDADKDEEDAEFDDDDFDDEPDDEDVADDDIEDLDELDDDEDFDDDEEGRSEEHTSELQSPCNLVCRLLLEKKKTV